AGCVGAGAQDFLDAAGLAEQGLAAFLDRAHRLDNRVGERAFGIDAADAGGAAAVVQLGDALGRREVLLKAADVAGLGVARVLAAQAGLVGEGAADLFADGLIVVADRHGVA